MNPAPSGILTSMKLTILLLSLFAVATFLVAAEPPAEGTKAPDFTLKSQDGTPLTCTILKGNGWFSTSIPKT